MLKIDWKDLRLHSLDLSDKDEFRRGADSRIVSKLYYVVIHNHLLGNYFIVSKCVELKKIESLKIF